MSQTVLSKCLPLKTNLEGVNSTGDCPLEIRLAVVILPLGIAGILDAEPHIENDSGIDKVIPGLLVARDARVVEHLRNDQRKHVLHPPRVVQFDTATR